jgi:hypothetical protein
MFSFIASRQTWLLIHCEKPILIWGVAFSLQDDNTNKMMVQIAIKLDVENDEAALLFNTQNFESSF